MSYTFLSLAEPKQNNKVAKVRQVGALRGALVLVRVI